MEKNRETATLQAGTERQGEGPPPVSRAFSSFLYAVWGIFLLFVGLNPIGLFLSLYVIVVPAWVLGCIGLYKGIGALVKREPSPRLAVIGTILASLVVSLPAFPFIAYCYPGITKGQTADILANGRRESPGAIWKAHLHGDAILGPLRDATNDFDINRPDVAENVLEVLSANRSSSSRAVLNRLLKRDNPYQRMIGAAGLVAHKTYFEKIDGDSYLIQTVRGYDPGANYHSWQVRQALRALGYVGSKEAVPAILSLFLRERTSYKILKEACGALARIGDRRAVPALRAYLGGRKDDAVTEVFLCLMSLGDRNAVPLAIDRAGRTQKMPDREDQDIIKPLEMVTGKKLGNDMAAWEAWWKQVEATWQVPERFAGACLSKGEK